MIIYAKIDGSENCECHSCAREFFERIKTIPLKDLSVPDRDRAYSLSKWFGKYKGQTVEQVMRRDASYLLWAEKKGIISLSDDLQEGVSECAEIQHRELMGDCCPDVRCEY